MKLEAGLIVTGSILLPTVENTGSTGNIWFDGTNVKYSTSAAVWSTSVAYPLALTVPQGFGSKTAGVVTGGNSSPAAINSTYEFDGTSWSAATAFPQTLRGGGASGPQDNGIVVSGITSPSNSAVCIAVSYNGSTWTSEPNSSTCTRSRTTHGTANSVTVAGGWSVCNNTEEFNGSSWSTGGNLSIGREQHTGGGTTNSAIVAAGYCGGPATSTMNSVEFYNGTSWSTGPNTITPGYAASGIGTQNSNVRWGGWPGSAYACTTDIYNGTSWSSGDNVTRGGTRNGTQVGNTNSEGLYVTGTAGGVDTATCCTEEYSESITACTL